MLRNVMISNMDGKQWEEERERRGGKERKREEQRVNNEKGREKEARHWRTWIDYTLLFVSLLIFFFYFPFQECLEKGTIHSFWINLCRQGVWDRSPSLGKNNFAVRASWGAKGCLSLLQRKKIFQKEEDEIERSFYSAHPSGEHPCSSADGSLARTGLSKGFGCWRQRRRGQGGGVHPTCPRDGVAVRWGANTVGRAWGPRESWKGFSTFLPCIQQLSFSSYKGTALGLKRFLLRSSRTVRDKTIEQGEVSLYFFIIIIFVLFFPSFNLFLSPLFLNPEDSRTECFMCLCHQGINESWEDRGGSRHAEPWPDPIATHPNNTAMISSPISHPAKTHNKWWGLVIKITPCIKWRAIRVHRQEGNSIPQAFVLWWWGGWVNFELSTSNCIGQHSLALFCSSFWQSLWKSILIPIKTSIIHFLARFSCATWVALGYTDCHCLSDSQTLQKWFWGQVKNRMSKMTPSTRPETAQGPGCSHAQQEPCEFFPVLEILLICATLPQISQCHAGGRCELSPESFLHQMSAIITAVFRTFWQGGKKNISK